MTAADRSSTPGVVRAPHPAKFSDSILEVLTRWIEPGWRVLDPFAGTGRIHEITHAHTYGIELEPEWAAWHPRTEVGNALDLPFEDGFFDCIATSPTYGNRMADSHDAKERCRPCKGTGISDGETCQKCKGAGRRDYKRITYTHQLGRKPTAGSSAVMQWGPKYRAFHEEAWAEADRVLRPGGLVLLNASDHIRNHQIQEVCDWHIETFEKMGYTVARLANPETRRMGFGANRDARVDAEMVAALRKPTAQSGDTKSRAQQ